MRFYVYLDTLFWVIHLLIGSGVLLKNFLEKVKSFVYNFLVVIANQ